jgi:alpha-tubulin suppressor-like RCC1 family protein
VDYAVEKLRHYFSKHGVISTPALIAAALNAHSVSAAPATLAPAVTALALTKGVAGGASTLTLVHGALKLMAWTKLKTAALTTTILLLATLGTVAVINHARHAPPRQTGRMKLPTGPVTPMVAYGFSHNILVLAGDGSLWSWGENRLGWPVLGLDNTNIQTSTHLRRIGHDADWVRIAAGMDDCLALKSDGSIWAWGANYTYQLGDGTKITRPTPVPSVPGNDWQAIAAGQGTSLAIKKDGTLWAWGSSSAGQAGIGGTHNKTVATEATQVGAATNWAKIWAGPIQTVGLQTDGSLWFWGSLYGDGQPTNEFRVPVRVSPDTNWVDACFGYFTVFAIKADGTLWTWGNEANYYTGTTDKSANDVPMQIGADTDWQSCASGIGFYQLLRKKDGTLWALDASKHRTIKPPQKYGPVKLVPLKLPRDIAAYTAGGDNIGVVLTPAGEVLTWGNVIGEHGFRDYETTNGLSHDPQLRVMTTPWQVANEE